MPVRPAMWADLKPAARIAALAFWEDEFMGDRLNPHRAKHPKSYERFFLHDLYESYYETRTRMLVSYPSNQSDRITGMAIWSRMGDGGKHMEASQSWLRWLMCRCIIPVYITIDSFIRPNRAADHTAWKSMEDFEPGMDECFKEPDYDETWDLELLFQAPQYQGRGFGKELVSWGLGRATEEGTRVSVASAPGKEDFYKKLGIDQEVKEPFANGAADPWPGTLLFSKKFHMEVHEV